MTDGGRPSDGGPSGDAPLATATRDRQILVVGGGLGGLALTALLDRAGYDPVAVDGGTRPASRAAVLPRVARAVLERAGVGLDVPGPVPGSLETVVSHRGTGGGTVRRTRLEAAPVVMSPERLCDRIRESVADRVVERRVTAVDDNRDALEVTFDDGVREWFDLVVVADRSDAWDGARAGWSDPAAFDQFEAVVDADLEPNRVVEWTTDGGLVQVGPLADRSGSLFRLTTAASDADGDTDLEPAETVARAVAAIENGPLGGVSPDDVGAVDRATVGQAVGAGGDWGGDLRGGRVAACGASALPVAPATGLRATVALEDAWTLSDELVRGAESVPEAVGTYARRRSRRVEGLLREATAYADRGQGDDGSSGADGGWAGDGVPPDDGAVSPLGSLTRYRAAALACFREPVPATLGLGDDPA